MSSFRTELASFWAYVDAILATLAVEPHAAPSSLGDDLILGALFSREDADAQLEPARARGKRHRSSHKTELMEKEKSSKRASSSIPVCEVLPTVAINVSTTDGAIRVADSTTDGAILVDVGTTEGDPSVDLAGSGKSDPSAC
uniref:Integrase core domain containing protein n=1 Tax=Solanum tuberosum TaxID=4113 RepID=M1DYH6_SOLTU